MRVIITGGTGFIGSRLAESLLADGAEVVVLSRSMESVRKVFDDRVSAALWDGKSAEDWWQFGEGADAVVNLAGAGLADSRWTPERKKLILNSRVNAGRAVTEAISRASVKPKVLVQASAVGYYGPRGLPAADESAPSGGGFLAEVCRAWESSTEAVEAMGVRRVIIRTSLVMAAHGGGLSRMLPVFRLGLGGPLGDGSQGFPWIHLDDEVGAIRFLMEHEESRGAYNLTAPETVDNRTFTRALAKALERPAVLGAPPFALRLLFGEMADEVLLSGQFVLPRRLTEEGYAFRHPILLAALEDLLRKA